MSGDTYGIWAVLVGIIVFIGVWIYAIAQWGFLLGIMVGWIPAMITAYIAGFLWPLLAVVIVLFIGFILMNS